MITIQLVSEDFSAQELKAFLEDQGVLNGLQATVERGKKEGLSGVWDSLLVEYNQLDPIQQEIVKEVVKTTIKYALRKAKEFLDPDPHIYVQYKNGQSKKIWYEGKSDRQIVRELLAEIEDGEVIKVNFKS